MLLAAVVPIGIAGRGIAGNQCAGGGGAMASGKSKKWIIL